MQFQKVRIKKEDTRKYVLKNVNLSSLFVLTGRVKMNLSDLFLFWLDEFEVHLSSLFVLTGRVRGRAGLSGTAYLFWFFRTCAGGRSGLAA